MESDSDTLREMFADDSGPNDAQTEHLLAAVESSLFGKERPEIRLDRYVLEKQLGRGGMGVVFAARDPELDRKVAIKFLGADARSDEEAEEGQRRMLREARLIAQIDHPNVVRVHDVRAYDALPEDAATVLAGQGVSDRGVFLVMEFIEGQTLKAWQDDRPWHEVVRAYVDAGRGLMAVHAAGLIHRDFKPNNVLVGADGRVRLLDFGLARSAGPVPGGDVAPGGDDVTGAGRIMGTPRYMAPEQIAGGELTARTDVFAFSVSLFEALTGEVPAAITGEVETEAPRWCLDLVRKGLAVDPFERWPNLAAMVAALDRRRRPRLSLAVGLASLVAIGAIAVVGSQQSPAPPSTPPSPALAEAPVPATDPDLVAALPFEVKTDNAAIKGGRDTLPSILIMSLGAFEGVQVADYNALARAAGPQADQARWREAAVDAGAGVLLIGRVEAHGSGLRLVVQLEAADGTALGSLRRETTLDGLSEAVRALAADAATHLTGRAATPRASHGWDYDALLAEGARLLEQGDFTAALERLGRAAAVAPEAPRARFYLAVALSWTEAPRAEVEAAFDQALATELDPADAAFLRAYRLYYDGDYWTAASQFEEALADHPGSRFLHYGWFESLYHGGDPRAAMEVFRVLGGGAPAIGIALMHVLDYYAAQGDSEGLQWALQFAPSVSPVFAEVWEVRKLVFDGDYQGLLERVPTLDPKLHPEAETRAYRMRALALSGQAALAMPFADADARREPPVTVPALALRTLQGDAAGRRTWFERTVGTVENARTELVRARAAADLLLLSVAQADERELKRLAEIFGPFDPEATLAMQSARTLLAGAQSDATTLSMAGESRYPGVRAMAAAFTADTPAAAAEHWRTAIEHCLDGRFITVARWHLARTLRDAGDRQGAARVCARVIAPPRFHWSWAGVVGSCRAWVQTP